MKRHIFAAIPAVIAIVAAFLSVFATHRHINETRQYAEQYKKSLLAVEQLVINIGKTNDFERIGYVISVREQAKAELANVRAALDYFERINPPKKLRSEHNDILSALNKERIFIDKLELVFEAHTADMLKKAVADAKKNVPKQADTSSFSNSLSRFIEKMEYLNKRNSRYDGFVWI